MARHKMDGVERRLTETHDDIAMVPTDQARGKSSIIDIPDEVSQTLTPPRALIKILEGRAGAACPQAFELTWESGPWRGLPVSGYCSEPLCISEGSCTGPRFVPHVDQFTTKSDMLRRRRKMTPEEVVAAVRAFAKMAARQTGREDERSDKAILAHVKMVWQKTIASIRGKGGQWRR